MLVALYTVALVETHWNARRLQLYSLQELSLLGGIRVMMSDLLKKARAFFICLIYVPVVFCVSVYGLAALEGDDR